MRVNFVANACNNHYVLAKAMRRHGFDARLFYDLDSFTQDMPEMEDPEVAAAAPAWLRPYHRQFHLWQQRTRVSPALLAELAECDILHAHRVEVVWAARTGRPFVFHPAGSDLAAWTQYTRDTLIGWRNGLPLPIVPHLLLPPAMRWALRQASAILIGWHHNMLRDGYRVIRALGLQDRVARIHLGIDTEKFTPCAQEERAGLIERLLPGRAVERPVIFHPTRQMFTDPAGKRGYKANDRLYRALGRFARDGHNFTLVVVEKGLPDEAAARRLIAEQGIAERTIWVKAMPRHELIAWYQAVDLTADGFDSGGLGSIALETMACGTPLIAYVQSRPETEDRDFFYDPKDLYPELPPVIACSTVEEIQNALASTVSKPERMTALRAASRRWVTTHSSDDAVARKCEALYAAILAGEFPARRSQVSAPVGARALATP
jgi:glycosyltransferase involved in cell wall biosynthesis